uniref:Uncharacterized protein n=1 Tax=Octopus bimaculoides TaxID=37653 RepID=A0A0L8GHQ0_OCTBM
MTYNINWRIFEGLWLYKKSGLCIVKKNLILKQLLQPQIYYVTGHDVVSSYVKYIGF